jgi:hypothetical protein
VVPLDIPHGIHREEPRERDGEVVPQAEQLPALVRQVVNELGVLAVLAREDLFELEHRGVDFHPTVPFEHAFDGCEHLHTCEGCVGKGRGCVGMRCVGREREEDMRAAIQMSNVT